jgi:urease accessory protein
MKTTVSVLAATLIATPALAHVDPVAHGSVAAGMLHPMLGTDHLAAMLAVGVLAATAPSRAQWTLPAAFVGAMAMGFALTVAGVQVPLVEPAILASVIVLGGLLALAARIPVYGLLALGAGFGVVHGAAHGVETDGAGILGFAAGMLVATALLHAAGTLFARMTLAKLKTAWVLRGAGLGLALVGAGSALV